MHHKEHKETETETEKIQGSMVHFILLHSYLIFLFAVIIGSFLDPLINRKMFSDSIYQIIGVIMLFFSSILIYWAQRVSSNYQQRTKKDNSKSHFEFGPYKYLRNPTHFGLFIMTLGFSFIINSFFSVILTIIAHAITKTFFVRKEEKILEEKYGETYVEYKKKVKDWI